MTGNGTKNGTNITYKNVHLMFFVLQTLMLAKWIATNVTPIFMNAIFHLEYTG